MPRIEISDEVYREIAVRIPHTVIAEPERKRLRYRLVVRLIEDSAEHEELVDAILATATEAPPRIHSWVDSGRILTEIATVETVEG